MPQVFISYSHDSPEHLNRVLALSDRLRAGGVDCLVDQYEQSPPEGWPQWCTRQVERSAFVLVACTETYLRRYKGEETPGTGLGGTWEGHIITQQLYNAQGRNANFIPILFSEDDGGFVPLELQGATRYLLPEDYPLLYRRVTGQPLITKPPLGSVEPMPSRESLPSQPAVDLINPAPPTQSLPARPALDRKQDFQTRRPLPNSRQLVSARREKSRFSVQFVNANGTPGAPLRIDIEKREIQDRLGDAATVFDSPAARISDVVRALRNNHPRVVHFSAHGTQLSEIVLLNARNEPKPVPKETLDLLFKGQKNIRLVVLNACFSRPQAEIISKYVDCVIGINGSIPDDAAIQYGVQFYDALAAGCSVQEAHDEATIVLTAARIAADQRPEIIPRVQVDPAKVYVGRTRKTKSGAVFVEFPPPESDDTQARKRKFEQERARLGVFAQASTITKICGPDGACLLEYKITGLSVTGDREIQELFFSLETEFGLMNAPVPDELADGLGIRWQPEEEAEPTTLQEVIDRVRRVRGSFVFEQPLRKDTGPYDFGWTIRVLNMDASTAWEFEHLYPTQSSRKHVNGKVLSGPIEYLARIAWLPLERFEMNLRLADPQISPAVRYFELAGNPEIPEDQIISGGLLRSFPTAGKWEANFRAERAEKPALRFDNKGAMWMFETQYPVLGSFYSLDWKLPVFHLSGKPERLVREAESLRRALCRHAETRSSGQAAAGGASAKLVELFDAQHHKAREIFASQAPDENFETTFMTFDDQQHRLIVVESLVTQGGVCSPAKQSWLPFGLGLAGACFRRGAGAGAYSRALDPKDPNRPENYLPIPGKYTHEFLLALPIDHPDLVDTGSSATRDDFQRSRQLAGVLAIGSTSGDSPLLEYCRRPPEDEEELKQLKESLRQLRDQFQAECDAIARLFLPKKAITQAASL